MTVQYAGIGLTPPDHASVALTEWWHGHRIDEWEYQGYFVSGVQHLPMPFPPSREPPRVGVLHWPNGADRWAVCHLVASRTQIDSIRTAIGSTPTAKPLVFSDGAGGTITTDMHAIIRPISQRGTHELYLLTLVDDRWFWWMTGGDTLSSVASSWSQLFTDLFALVGVTPTIDAIPAAYLTPNATRWDTDGQPQPIPVLIEAAARQIGMRVVRRLDGSVRVQIYSTASSEDTSRWNTISTKVMAGGRLTGADIGRVSPASVDVCFFDDTKTNVTLTSLALSDYAGVNGVAAKKGRVTVDPAEPTTGEKTALATQAATDYYNWNLALTDATLRAFVNVDPNGLDEFVEWVHTPAKLITRIVRPQWTDRNIYGDAAPDAQATGEELEYQDYCINGTLVRRVATLSLGAGGLTQTAYTYEVNLGVPCTGGISGSGLSGSDAPPVPPQAGDPLALVEMACPVIGSVRRVTTDYQATADDFKIVTEGTITITLPLWEDGLFLIIVNSDGGTVTVESAEAGDINGTASVQITVAWDALTFDTLDTEGDWFAH